MESLLLKWQKRLIRLLGYRFSPRLADIEGTRLWRFDPKPCIS
ncbi:transposase [Clostridium tagluense]|nr:transposase [Clostridium tagluense]